MLSFVWFGRAVRLGFPTQEALWRPVPASYKRVFLPRSKANEKTPSIDTLIGK